MEMKDEDWSLDIQIKLADKELGRNTYDVKVFEVEWERGRTISTQKHVQIEKLTVEKPNELSKSYCICLWVKWEDCKPGEIVSLGRLLECRRLLASKALIIGYGKSLQRVKHNLEDPNGQG
ncbi:hypothetical protein Tco_0591925 [Tanacetum coccineum]